MKMKKITALLSTLSILCTLAVTPVQAADTPLTIFTDNVESHTVYTQVGSSSTTDIENNVAGIAGGYGYAGSTGDVLVENTWAVSPTFGGNKTEYRIRYDKTAGTTSADDTDTDNQVIALSTGTIKNSLQNALALTADVGNESDFLYSVDMRNYYTSAKKFVTPVSGIRIVDPADETSYYELALISDSDTAADRDSAKVNPPRFTKVSGAEYATPAAADVGAEPDTWLYTEYGPEGTASGYYGATPKTYYFTLTLAKSGNTICWSVLDQATNEIVWEDSYVDADPLFDGMGQLQLFTYGKTMKGATTVFDNVTVKKAGTALYRDDAVTSVAADDMESYATAGNTDGVWTASEVFGSDSNASFLVNYNKSFANNLSFTGGDTNITDNKALWIWAAGGQMALNYNGAVADQYTVDLRNYSYNGRTNPVMGIRLVDPTDETNYYELALISTTEHTPFAGSAISPPRFTKVVGGAVDTPAAADTAPAEVEYQTFGAMKTISGCTGYYYEYRTNWFTLELGKVDDVISWKVYDAESGEAIWSSSYQDDEPLFSGAGQLQVFTYGGSSAVMADNVKCDNKATRSMRVEANWAKVDDAAPLLVVADYDADGKMVRAETIAVADGNIGCYLSNNVFPVTEDTKKLFLWNDGSLQPIDMQKEHQELDIDDCVVTYPNYGFKAATVSIDDGDLQWDEHFIELMQKYGLRGTFNLTDSVNDNMVPVYTQEGLEIANHTSHINMSASSVTYEACVASMKSGYDIIKNKTGVEPKGLIWPYSEPITQLFHPDLVAYIRDNYEYARPAGSTYSYDLPYDWAKWNATAWMGNDDWGETYWEDSPWFEVVENFVALEPGNELKCLMLAGHAVDQHEYTYVICETVFPQLTGDDIWKATCLEICRYVKAARQLEIADSYVYNPTSETVYMLINGEQYVAAPYSYAVAA